jgi:hypothetical protein
MDLKYDMNQLLDEQEIVDVICPICGKNFIPAPFHAFKTYGGTRVCSWTCQLRGERENYRPKATGPEVKPVLMFQQDGTFMEEFESAAKAEEKLRIARESIRKCCRGETSNAGGFVFRYKPKEGKDGKA